MAQRRHLTRVRLPTPFADEEIANLLGCYAKYNDRSVAPSCYELPLHLIDYPVNAGTPEEMSYAIALLLERNGLVAKKRPIGGTWG